MDTIFPSLHAYMLQTKTLTYVLMGVGLVALLCFWHFLRDRDDDIRKY